MRYIKLKILAISLLILGCNTKPRNNSDFETYTRSVPLIQLPYSTTCGTCCNIFEQEVDTILSEKFNPDNFKIVGKFPIYDEYLGILYAGEADYLVPILIIYDNNGKKVAEEQFLSHTHCGQILDNYGASFMLIDKQFEIIEKDTNLLFLLDSTDYSIKDTMERNINFSKYKIDETGKIIKINAS